jgi:hypothetical protein
LDFEEEKRVYSFGSDKTLRRRYTLMRELEVLDCRVVFTGGNVYVIGQSRIERRNLSLGRSLHNRRCELKLKEGVVSLVLFSLLTTTALAQTRGGSFTLRYTSFSPIVSLAAGILILIFPKLLRFIVGFYLILVGLLGLLGR